MAVSLSRAAGAEERLFHFAPVGQSYSAAIFQNDPIVGQEVTSARIILEIEAFDGSDAADFFTDLLIPVEPHEGNTNVIVLRGSDLGWSGSGKFRYELETDEFNGIVVARRYGGETPAENFRGRVIEGSGVEITTGSGGECGGKEKIKRATCNRRGKLKIKLAGGAPSDSFVAELSSGDTQEGTLDGDGKGKAAFKRVSGAGDVAVSWGCGAKASRPYECG